MLLTLFPPKINTEILLKRNRKKKKKLSVSSATDHDNGLLTLERQNGGWLVLSALFSILFHGYMFSQ